MDQQLSNHNRDRLPVSAAVRLESDVASAREMHNSRQRKKSYASILFCLLEWRHSAVPRAQRFNWALNRYLSVNRPTAWAHIMVTCENQPGSAKCIQQERWLPFIAHFRWPRQFFVALMHNVQQYYESMSWVFHLFSARARAINVRLRVIVPLTATGARPAFNGSH